MPTSSHFEYRGWRVKAGRAEMSGAYDGEARKDGHGRLRTERFYGTGAKVRAEHAIKAKIDEEERCG